MWVLLTIKCPYPGNGYHILCRTIYFCAFCTTFIQLVSDTSVGSVRNTCGEYPTFLWVLYDFHTLTRNFCELYARGTIPGALVHLCRSIRGSRTGVGFTRVREVSGMLHLLTPCHITHTWKTQTQTQQCTHLPLMAHPLLPCTQSKRTQPCKNGYQGTRAKETVRMCHRQTRVPAAHLSRKKRAR